MKKLIIFGSNIFPLSIGGTEISIYEIILELQKRKKYEIYLFLSNVDSRNIILKKNLPEVHLLFNRCFKNMIINKIARNLFILINLLKTKPDSILSFSFSDMSLHSILYTFLFRKNLITRTEGSDIHFFKSIFETLNKRFILRYSNQIICISEYHAKIISNLNIKLKSKPFVLGNGSRFKSTEFLKRNNQTCQILFVGRLQQIKNVETLIDSLYILRQRYHINDFDINLKICGNGPLETKLSTKVKSLNLQDSIEFLGRVINYNALFSLYANADIFILPSFVEGSPLVIFEALSFGSALICSRIPSLTHELEEEINALFFNPYSKEDLAEKIYTLIINKDLLNKMQRNNYELSRKYSWNSIVTEIEKLL